MARSERFELPTLGFEVRCSIQLSYERLRGLDYQTWLDRASTLPAGQSRLRASIKRPQGAAGFRHVTEEFPHQENVGILQLVIVAEFELIHVALPAQNREGRCVQPSEHSHQHQGKTVSRHLSEAGVPAAVLANIGRRALSAGIGRGAV